MQEARDEVLAIYHAYGLDKSSEWEESEDHVAAELEFMQVLCARTTEALKAGDEDKAAQLLQTQKNFLEDHLASWTPMMTVDIRRLAKTKFYLGLADLTDGFLAEDEAFLNEVLGDEE